VLVVDAAWGTATKQYGHGYEGEGGGRVNKLARLGEQQHVMRSREVVYLT
jgi:hypothetical protein